MEQVGSLQLHKNEWKIIWLLEETRYQIIRRYNCWSWNNHVGRFKDYELIKNAKESGADAVKLQLIDANSSYQNTVSFKEFSMQCWVKRSF